MVKIQKFALSLLLSMSVFSTTPSAAMDSALFPTTSVDEALAAGLDMVLINSSPLRNGDNVWQRLSEGFQLPEVNASLVRHYERVYSAHPERFKRTLDRGRKYLFHIINELEYRGMPTEIALLPMVESAFVPTALSHAGASGLWQFMPMTGQRYGLEQTRWYDGRRDVVKATRAALDYLETLYGLLGDWHLALAAYNWGEGNLLRAIARTENTGLNANYETVRLPSETRHYVPKLLAIRNLLAEPKKFGLKLEKFPNRPYFVAVTPGRHMDSHLAAKLAGISLSEFNALNPAFNLPVFAHKSGRQMLIPATHMATFEDNLSRWDKPLFTWQVYTPSHHETAHTIAHKTGMSLSELLTVNKLRSHTLPPGQPILVSMKNEVKPSVGLAQDETGTSDHDRAAPASTPSRHTVMASSTPLPTPPGTPTDNTQVASRSASLSSEEEKPRIDTSTPSALSRGTVTTLAHATQEEIPTEYVVRRGDTVFSIARRFGVKHHDIVRWNGASMVVRLQPGQRVKILGS